MVATKTFSVGQKKTFKFFFLLSLFLPKSDETELAKTPFTIERVDGEKFSLSLSRPFLFCLLSPSLSFSLSFF
jgi:hypothetical protein